MTCAHAQLVTFWNWLACCLSKFNTKSDSSKYWIGLRVMYPWVTCTFTYIFSLPYFTCAHAQLVTFWVGLHFAFPSSIPGATQVSTESASERCTLEYLHIYIYILPKYYAFMLPWWLIWVGLCLSKFHTKSHSRMYWIGLRVMYSWVTCTYIYTSSPNMIGVYAHPVTLGLVQPYQSSFPGLLK